MTSAPLTRATQRLRGALRDDTRRYPGLLLGRREVYSRITLALALFAALFFGAQLIAQAPHGVSRWDVAGTELLYLGCLGALLLFRFALDLRVIWGALALGVVGALGLSVTYERGVGVILLTALAYLVVFRLPARWSLPAVAPLTALFVTLEVTLTPPSHGRLTTGLWPSLVSYALVIFGGVATRARALTLKDLRETQARLRAELTRNEQLAVARERARIARDMHDVLAHSLTLLSVQTQAARQLVRQDPDRAAQMLDEMAQVVRESAAESRRLVSVLREASAVQEASPPGERLRALAERFGERSGVRVAVEEAGDPQPLDDTREAALRYALQEALTNAYRHGAAQHVWATLRWRPAAVTLEARDDGNAQHSPKSLLGGGNGLRGMRERAEALGGTLTTAPLAEGGYSLTLTLPLARDGDAQDTQQASSTPAPQTLPEAV